MNANHRGYRRGQLAERGFTLVELLIVVALLAIVVGSALPRFESGVADQLQAVGIQVVADLDYVQALAIADNAPYRVAWRGERDGYDIERTAATTARVPISDLLPRDPDSSGDRRSVRLDALLPWGIEVRLVRMRWLPSGASTMELDFQPLGGTSSTEDTEIWLGGGAGTDRRYIPIRVNAVTGLAAVGEIHSTIP